MDGAQIQWKTQEHIKQKHGSDWFWTIGTVALGFVIAAIIFDNVLLAVLIVVATVALILQTIKKPPLVTFTINDEGVMIGKTLYAYEDLESFSITEKNILIKSKKKLMPFITIPLPEKSRDDIHTLLYTYLLEKEHTEPVADTIMEELGF